MLHVSILALLAPMALAGPLSPRDSLLENRFPSAPSTYIAACEAADNCETYIDPTTGQPKIRFKAGMEPGTEDYTSRVANSKIKRQSGSHTEVTVGDETIYWGCGIDPVATLNNVSSVCPTSGSCIPTDSWSTSVSYISPTNSLSTSPEPLTITATGAYPSWLRNGLIAGVQAAMSAKGVIDTSTITYQVSTGPTNKNGAQTKGASCQVAKAPNSIGLVVFSSPNVMEAMITVSIAVQTPESGFCATVGGPSGIAGAIAGVFGAPGAALAAIFGVVSASCSMVSSK